jgi:N-acetylneuraminate synthase
MKSDSELDFCLVKPNEIDARLIMQWRNDPMTRKASVHQELKVWDSFFPDFLTNYFILPALPPLFILANQQKTGVVYFKPISHPLDSARRCIEISINIDPLFRAKGIGGKALKNLNKLVKQQGFDSILASVRKENTSSAKVFLEAGYRLIGEKTIEVENSSETCLLDLYLIELTEVNLSDVFIIAEAGSNWRMGSEEEDLKMCKKLIEIAKESGADAIKFQVFKPETIYVSNAGVSQYLSDAGIEEEMQTIFNHLAMPYEMIPVIADYCKKINIEFMASSFSKSDFLAIDPYVKRHKIASYEIGHVHLIELAAKSQKPVLISTGASTEAEIVWAVDTFRKFGGKNLSLMQCTAKYPAQPDSMNLRAIAWLKDRFKLPVGLSDHSDSISIAAITSVAFGAKFIEKHFTVDKTLPGPDHAFALNPEELKEMIDAIREAEQMLGNWVKEVHYSEEELRYFAKRGIQAIKDIRKGDLFEEDLNIAILRPGTQVQGIHPKYIDQIQGKKALKDIPLGTGIQRNDWE